MLSVDQRSVKTFHWKAAHDGEDYHNWVIIWAIISKTNRCLPDGRLAIAWKLKLPNYPRVNARLCKESYKVPIELKITSQWPKSQAVLNPVPAYQ